MIGHKSVPCKQQHGVDGTDNKVLHLTDLLKDGPASYVVNWIYIGRSRVRVSCICTLAHQMFAAQVAAMYKLPPFNPWSICCP